MIAWHVSFVDEERKIHIKVTEALTKSEAIRTIKLQNGEDITILEAHSLSE